MDKEKVAHDLAMTFIKNQLSALEMKATPDNVAHVYKELYEQFIKSL